MTNLDVSGFHRDGQVIFWYLGSLTDITAVSDRLHNSGCGKYAPNKRTPLAILKDAVTEVLPGHRIEPIKNEDAVEAIKVTKVSPTENSYQKIATAIVKYGFISCPQSFDMERKIQERYDELGNYLNHYNTTRLLSIALEDMGAIMLKPSGGLWYLPPHAIDRFSRIANAVEQSAKVTGENRVISMPAIIDEKFSECIITRLTEDITKESIEIESVLFDETTGNRAKSTQKARAKVLHERIESYETLLGKALNDLHAELDRASQHVAVASLFESAASVEESELAHAN